MTSKARELKIKKHDHLYFLESMDRVNRAIQGTGDQDSMLHHVLEEVLGIFNCDRCSLLYPCDPESPTWTVPMESTRLEYPGAFNLGTDIPTNAEASALFQIMLDSHGPVQFNPESQYQLPAQEAQQFNIQSLLAVSIHPKGDKPWMFNLHQCSHPRSWSDEETRLFQEIGRRLDDALTVLLMQRDLQESEAKYRHFVEASREGIWAIDQNYLTTFVNARMAEMVGYSTNELIGHPLSDFMFEEDIADYKQHMKLRLEGISEYFERRFRCKDGSELWVQASASAIKGDNELFQGSFAMHTDITKRKLAEQTALQNEEALKEAQRIAHMGSWHLILETNEVVWSEELYRMCDCDPTLPPPDYDVSSQLYTSDSWGRLTSAMTQTVEKGTPYELELEMVQKQGDNKWIWARGELVRDTEDKPVLVRGVALDITERKRAEQVALQNEEALKEAQRIAHMGSWHLDLATNEVTWSEELYRIYGFELTQSVPNFEETAKLFTAESWERLNAEITHTLETATPYEIEMEMIQTDGTMKWVQARGELVRDTEGKPVELRGVLMDITERKLAEQALEEKQEQLLQAQKMESVGTLVGGIAHDFNNKLAAIIGNLYLVQGKVEPQSPLATRLNEISKLSFEAADIIKQLLTFARKGSIEQTVFSLTSFIKENIKLNKVTIPEDIHLSINYAAHPLIVKGDATQLQQVLLNLLNNARDAVQVRDEAHVEISLLEHNPDDAFYAKHPEAKRTVTYACLKVTDNGNGIAKENMDKIFDPFFTTKPVGSGTGLGLAMVYGIVQSHQGIIEVTSALGDGCTVSVYLPLVEDEKEDDFIGQQGHVFNGQGETILVADDDEHVREIFEQVLTSMNYRVLVAKDGKEAVAIYQLHQSEIDLVILDIIMPGLRGPQVAVRIREMTPNIKLLFASGYDGGLNSDSGEVIDEKVLNKPFDIGEVSREIRQLLDG